MFVRSQHYSLAYLKRFTSSENIRAMNKNITAVILEGTDTAGC